MSSFDDIVAIVEVHRRRWKCFPSSTISLTKSLRVAGSLVSHPKTQRFTISNVESQVITPNNSRLPARERRSPGIEPGVMV